MGTFNEIRMQCSGCDKEHYVQTKNGIAMSQIYDISVVPYELVPVIDGYQWQCERCDKWNKVIVWTTVRVK
jgi:hypothetical protein